MAFCPSCGANNPIESRRCYKCTMEIPSAPTTEQPRTSYQPPFPAQPPVVIIQSPYKHPAYLAVLSLFWPGLGLLFIPNRAPLGMIAMGAYVFMWIVAVVLSAVYIGCCIMVLIPIFNIVAAIYSYDSGAKLTNGEFKPMIFR